jgi:hypothetical protein
VQVPTLVPYLDLSLVQSITFIMDGFAFYHAYVTPGEDDVLRVPESRRQDIFVPHRLLSPGRVGPTFSPLKIDSLTLELGFSLDTKVWLFFDPKVIRAEGYLPSDAAPYDTSVPVLNGPDWFRFTQLREITCVNSSIAYVDFFTSITSLSSGPLSLRWEVASSTDWDEELLSYLVRGITSAPVAVLPYVGEVVVQVRTEETRAHLLQKFANSPLLARTSVLVKPA